MQLGFFALFFTLQLSLMLVIKLTLIMIFASAISIQQYNDVRFNSELNYPMFISAIYGLSLAWFPFPIAYVVLRFLLDDLQHEYPKQ
ncbi:hypothetical protein [Klebsiella quasipneumoniae]|uniref:hypothetical protein n=1 Tax=Klebsiella quasipneumoniae TaxID=1463165 RepID=UPI0022094D44|nr:hypothetical protein [Klebsiella quasipneumoniae]BDO05968.1 hypothetical protein KAM622c_55550 [Klebsiella quasipneumoniae subsp. quasipneumoniae]